jgi:hypothetical protein
MLAALSALSAIHQATTRPVWSSVIIVIRDLRRYVVFGHRPASYLQSNRCSLPTIGFRQR